MRKYLLPSLFVLSFAAAPAHAQDETQYILSQPSMSLSASGARSAPPAMDEAVPPVVAVQKREAPAPVAAKPEKAKKPVKAKEAKKPAAKKEEKAAAPVPKPEAAPAVAAPAVAAAAPATETPATVAPAPQAAVHGASLQDVLALAYASSPVLRAEREVLRQQYENVAVAQSRTRPVVTAEGGVAWNSEDTDPGTDEQYTTADAGVALTQYLYRGGRTLAEVERQLRLSDAAMAAYDSATQDVFLNVVVAAMDIQQSRATIDLTEQNRTVIERQLQMAQRGFEVGELTRTDVAQAQARLSGAEAQLVSSRADYSSALARLRQYAGQDGAALALNINEAAVPMPPSFENAKTTGLAEHPAIRAAREAEKAAQSAVKVAEGALRPEIYANARAGLSKDPNALVDDARTASVGVRASMPLYEGGGTRAQIRQAKHGLYEQRDRAEDAARVVEQLVTTAWNDYQAARAAIAAREEQVGAARMARDGVYKEREVGTRTVLDTLNADAELLDAQVELVRAARNNVVAGYALLAAGGQLTAEKLGFFDKGAEKAHLTRAQNAWFGTDAKPADGK